VILKTGLSLKRTKGRQGKILEKHMTALVTTAWEVSPVVMNKLMIVMRK